jgi:hypothetical protein
MPRRGDMHQIESKKPPLIPLRIAYLKPSTPPLSKESQAVIDFLRSYLKRAEAGKIHGVCITTDNEDETYDAEWAGSYDKYPTTAVGPVEVLKLKLTRKALDDF